MDPITRFVDDIFAAFPATPEVERAKRDLLAGMSDQYEALRAEGKSEAEAVGTVILNFGSAEELAQELGARPAAASPPAPGTPTPAPVSPAPATPAAVPVSPAGPAAADPAPPEFPFVGGIGVMVGSGQNLPKTPTLARLQIISSIYWPLTVVIYFVASFLTGRWDITWIIWPISGVVFGLIGAVTAALTQQNKAA